MTVSLLRGLRASFQSDNGAVAPMVAVRTHRGRRRWFSPERTSERRRMKINSIFIVIMLGWPLAMVAWFLCIVFQSSSFSSRVRFVRCFDAVWNQQACQHRVASLCHRTFATSCQWCELESDHVASSLRAGVDRIRGSISCGTPCAAIAAIQTQKDDGVM